MAPLLPDEEPEKLQDGRGPFTGNGLEPSAEDYEKALQAGMSRARAMLLQEREMDESHSNTPKMHPSGLRSFAFRKPQRAAKMISSCRGRLLLEGSISYLERFGISPSRAIDSLEELNAVLAEDRCSRVVIPECEEGPDALLPELRTIECDPSQPYRTMDGTCNNLANYTRGAARTPFVRMLDPTYEDGVNEPRGEGRPCPFHLPSPRTVSVRIHSAGARSPVQRPSLMVMQWGQFLDHDLALTPEASGMSSDGEVNPIPCCEDGKNGESDESVDPGRDCRPIPTLDDFSQQHSRTCMRFVRSMVASRGCMMGPREQISQATSYIDGSVVYGSSEEEARTLRTMSGGNLITSSFPNPHLMALPYEQSQRPAITRQEPKPGSSSNNLLSFLPIHPCEPEIEDGVCFLAGDERVNEQPALASMQTLWLRVHQSVVQGLAALNPTWDDETLYQEARRVVGALIQQTTYREFLPVVLGWRLMRRYDLIVARSGANTYNQSVDATVANVFATAAFRFGHTLVRETLLGAGGREVSLADSFFNPEALLENGTTPTHLLQGLTRVPSQPIDPFLTPTLIQRLFVVDNEPIGLDLMSLNIQDCGGYRPVPRGPGRICLLRKLVGTHVLLHHRTAILELETGRPILVPEHSSTQALQHRTTEKSAESPTGGHNVRQPRP